MSSSSDTKPAAAAVDTEALLKEKDKEIASLKQEIASLKSSLTKKKKQSTVESSVENISKASLKHLGGASTKVEARWKARFQQLVAYKVRNNEWIMLWEYCCVFTDSTLFIHTLFLFYSSNTAIAMLPNPTRTSLSTLGFVHNAKQKRRLI